MKWLSAGLTFVNVATVCGVLGGIAAHGLGRTVAALSIVVGLLAALLAWWMTCDGEKPPPAPRRIRSTPESKIARRSRKEQEAIVVAPASQRYRSTWLWIMVILFAIFALRSFCNVLFIDGNELKIQSPNNLGDLSLHVTYIKNFASGVPLWPDNPIYVFSKLRYPAGVDVFNALLACLDVDIIIGLVWAGLLASAATCYALYRWGGAFTIAGFLFNGGLAGWQFFRNYEWKDYQGVSFIGWKSLALSMFVTQRGLLYAIPVGLLLLFHWRAKYFPPAPVETVSPAPAAPELGEPVPAETIVSKLARGPLPFWVELSLYATLPLFHLHTFLALSLVLAFLFLFHNGAARWQLILLVAAALLPASFFVWLITDHFHAGSVLQWLPGWVQNDGDFTRPLAAFAQQPTTVAPPVPGLMGWIRHFFQFWIINFGITLPLLLVLVVLLALRAWKHRDDPAPVKIRLIAFLGTLAVAITALASLLAYFSFGYSLFAVLALIPPVAFAVMIPLFASLLQRDWRQTIPITAPVAFVLPAVALFLFACFVKTAPWAWDNIKLIIWAYLIVLPFLWSELVSRWVFPVRAVVCIVLFGSGFVTLFGGLAAGRTGFGLADRTELDAVAVAVNKLPADARFAAFPTYNHPLLLQGRKLILGYPGHVWTQGFNYNDDFNKLGMLMNGAPGWKKIAEDFHTRYVFWGREEKNNYGSSKRPWEQESTLVASGPWGSIYDLESAPAPPSAAALTPPPAPIPTPVPAVNR